MGAAQHRAARQSWRKRLNMVIVVVTRFAVQSGIGMLELVMASGREIVSQKLRQQ
jgi:hypothetical protein